MEHAARIGCELARNQPIAYSPRVVPSTAASFRGSRLNHPSSSNFFLSVANAGFASPGRLSLECTPVSGRVPYAVGTPEEFLSSDEPNCSSGSSSGPKHVGSMASRLAAVSSPLGPYECSA